MPPRCAGCLRADLIDDLARWWDITPTLAARVVDGALAQPGPRSREAYILACFRRFQPWWWRQVRRVLPVRRPPPAPRRPCRHLPAPPPVLELDRAW